MSRRRTLYLAGAFAACALYLGGAARAMPADNLPGPSPVCSTNGGGCLLGPPVKV